MARRSSSATRRDGEERLIGRGGEERLINQREGWLRETHQQAISDGEEIHLPARRMVRMIHSPAGTMLRRGSSASN